MAIRDVVLMGDPVLRREADPVGVFDDELRTLVRDMFETMYHEDGLGLAAPQIGISRRVLVVDIRDKEKDKDKDKEDDGGESSDAERRIALVNPRVTWSSEDTDRAPEGCLSIPGLEEVVERPAAVTIEAFDQDGNPVAIRADGLFGRALQHEIDHLDGILFPDRLSPFKRRMLLKKWRKLRAEAGQEVGR